ncbi:MAG: K(+)-stimulated pyrophosphate-energized sodium pump, partial [Gammaproteobacteria bacterium]
ADARVICGFGLGAAIVALFSRVGGGIFRHGLTIEPASLGADQHDSASNEPHKQAALMIGAIGNNVSGIAGLGAELFVSYSGAIIAAIVIAASMPASNLLGPRGSLMFVPLALTCAGLVCSIVGIMLTRSFTDKSPQAALRAGTISATLAFIVLSLFLMFAAQAATGLWWVVVSGVIGGVVIALTTGYFTAGAPMISIARAAQKGAATAMISGFVIGMRSTVVPVLTICAVTAVASEVAGLYGVAIAAVGMLATLGMTMAVSAYSPIATNACSIAKMTQLDAETQKITNSLGELGHSTAAIGQGFATGAAALAALAIIFAFVQTVTLHLPGFNLNLSNAQVLVGLLIGAVLPFFIAALAMNSATDAASQMIEELRHQLREIPGRAAGTAQIDTTRCVGIAADASITKMALPSVIAVLAPLVVGFGISPEALGGMLGGALLSGIVLALTMGNAGNAWSNAKKYVEQGNLGGTDSAAHAALSVGAAVGSPFKATAAPTMNILIILMAIVSLLIAPSMS